MVDDPLLGVMAVGVSAAAGVVAGHHVAAGAVVVVDNDELVRVASAHQNNVHDVLVGVVLARLSAGPGPADIATAAVAATGLRLIALTAGGPRQPEELTDARRPLRTRVLLVLVLLLLLLVL